MDKFLYKLQTWAFESRRYGDIYMAVIIVCVLGLFIIPVPFWVLDTLIATNLMISVVLLMMSLYVRNALAISTFPSLLLVTTLFRLALSITSTRMILVEGYAGEIIFTFGKFVVGGNFIVGAVIFLILLIVQFIVITKGAERVAEVTARFTLDAMPGKQMSIDADMRAGVADHKEAQRRRSVLEKENSLFGAMDGAMKFVKGDAIATMIIVAINIVAGLCIGIFQRGEPASEAVQTYSILTIGDGLVSQIPALMISITAAVIITRITTDEDQGLGSDIFGQIMAVPKAIFIAGFVVFGLGLIPGFPKIQFFMLAFFLLVAGYLLRRRMTALEAKKKGGPLTARSDSKSGTPSAGAGDHAEEVDDSFSITVPVMVEADNEIRRILDPEALNKQLILVRRALYLDLGVPFPGIHLRYNGRDEDGAYRILLQEVPMSEGRIRGGYLYVRESADNLRAFGLADDPVDQPVDRREAFWVSEANKERLQAIGCSNMDPAQLLSYHISLVLKRYASEFIGIQEVRSLLTQMEGEYGEIVREVQRVMTPQRIAEVLQRLVQEEISVRNLKAIFQGLIEWAPKEKDTLLLTEYVRLSLKRYISHKHSAGQNVLVAYLLEPSLEEVIRKAVRQTSAGSFLALEPATAKKIVEKVRERVGDVATRDRMPVLLTSMDVRRYVRKLIEIELPDLAVLSHQELSDDINIQPLGRIKLD
jgi:type III secretion protein V